MTINDPRMELYRLLDEGRADIIAGRKRPLADVMADIKKEIIAHFEEERLRQAEQQDTSD